MSRINVLGLDAASYTRHSLHAEDKVWVEKNCYVDIWIEVIHAIGCEPLAIAPFVKGVTPGQKMTLVASSVMFLGHMCVCMGTCNLQRK